MSASEVVTQLLPRCVFRAGRVCVSHASGHQVDRLAWASWTGISVWILTDQPALNSLIFSAVKLWEVDVKFEAGGKKKYYNKSPFGLYF